MPACNQATAEARTKIPFGQNNEFLVAWGYLRLPFLLPGRPALVAFRSKMRYNLSQEVDISRR